MRSFSIACLLLFNISSIAQPLSQCALDTVSDEYLLELSNIYLSDSIAQHSIIQEYMNRGHRQGDSIKIARAFDRFARIYNPEKNIVYADSLIDLTSGWEHITYPGLGYIIKAYEYSRLNDFVFEYENLLKAFEIAKKRDNLPQQMYVSDQIVVLQAHFGSIEKALTRQIERHKWFDKPNYFDLLKKATREELHDNLSDIYIEHLLGSYRTFIVCYFVSKEYDKVEEYLHKLDNAIKLRGESTDYYKQREWSVEAWIELNLRKGNFTSALEASEELIRDKLVSGDHQGLKSLYFLNGLSLFGMNEEFSGYLSLIKADSIRKIQPNLLHYHEDLELCTILYEMNREKANYEEAIGYLDEIIGINTEVRKLYEFLEPALIEQFETPDLILQKQQLIEDLKSRNKQISFMHLATSILLIMSLILSLLYFQRQRLYKKRFEKLINSTTNESPSKKRIGLNASQVQEIMDGLELFEKDQGFRDAQINLAILAKQLGTNTNYLSRVINLRFEKNFSQFLHDRRVEYAQLRLLKDKKFRLYTIRAIAEESGYNNVESFSRAFYKRNGIYPSFYIKNLDKNEA